MKPTLFFYTIILFSNLICMGLTGQETGKYNIKEYLQNRQYGQGRISISIDDLILENLHRHILFNAKNPAIPGYRIRIFSDSGFDSNERALSTMTLFISKYESIGAYLQYDVPDFKVYVGDCRTKSEALKIFEMIKKDFPYSFIVPQNINLPKE